MQKRRNISSMIAVMLFLSWTICFVRGEESSLNTTVTATATAASAHSTAHNSNNSRSREHHQHDSHENNYNRLRSSTTTTSSLGDHDHDHVNDNDMMKELKEIVMFLSQKIDDSDGRIRSLEEKAKAQDVVIQNLETDVNDASSFHRFLQRKDSDCLPRFSNTSTFGPRCEFNFVTSFQNRTFFNDTVVFNKTVEFDPDTNCLPTFNSTTRMCRYNNNFTFDEGNILFEHDVRFDDDVKFDEDVSFRGSVEMKSDVDFNNNGQVTFNKPTKFTEDVLIKNDNHDIDFKLEDKVKAKFYQDKTFEVDTYTSFYKDVTFKKNLHVDGTLRVEKKTKLDDLELYGYLWVDGTTHLDGGLEADDHVTIKKGLTVESGGLDVNRDGAHIVGSTELDGTLELHGDGWADGSFDVDGKLSASSVLIDNSNHHHRNLESSGGHDTPSPTSVPISNPLLQVRGDADIDGTLHAHKIQSNNINGGSGNNNNNNNVDLEQIVNLVKIELRDSSIVFGDVTVINNLNQQEEVVLTETRMLDLMSSANLKVNTITANGATINGNRFPFTDDSGSSITSEEIVRLLKNQNLSVNSLEANNAEIGNRFYPHVDPLVPDHDDITSDEIVGLLRGQQLDVSSVTANTATINGEVYPLSPSPNDSPSVNIDEIVKELKEYRGEVTISKLLSVDLDVISTVERTDNGGSKPALGRLRLNGNDVATSIDIKKLEDDIEAIADSGGGNEDDNEGVTTEEVVRALQGASISVSSLEVSSSISRSGAEVATINDVDEMVADIKKLEDDIKAVADSGGGNEDDNEGVTTEEVVRALQGASISVSSLEASSSISRSGAEVATIADVDEMVDEAAFAADNTAAPASCTCEASDVEAVVTSEFVRNMVTEDFVKSMGFMTEEGMAELDLDLDCTCTKIDVRENIDETFLGELGVAFVTDDEPESCACSTEVIQEAVSGDYIERVMKELGVSYGETEVSCTCSEDDITSVVTSDYISGMDLNDEVPIPECVCEIEDSQIKSIIDGSYISGLGFLSGDGAL